MRQAGEHWEPSNAGTGRELRCVLAGSLGHHLKERLDGLQPTAVCGKCAGLTEGRGTAWDQVEQIVPSPTDVADPSEVACLPQRGESAGHPGRKILRGHLQRRSGEASKAGGYLRPTTRQKLSSALPDAGIAGIAQPLKDGVDLLLLIERGVFVRLKLELPLAVGLLEEVRSLGPNVIGYLLSIPIIRNFQRVIWSELDCGHIIAPSAFEDRRPSSWPPDQPLAGCVQRRA